MDAIRKLDWKVLLLGFALVSNILIWYAVFAEDRGGTMKVSFLDVGQGDAIFVEGPTGIQVLIDGGATPGVLRELGWQMPFYDRSIDAVIATHPDKDHIGGLPDVLRRYRVGALIETSAESDTAYDEALAGAAVAKKTMRITAKRGQVIDVGGGAEIAVLFPDRDMKGSETNDASVIAKLTYGEVSFLLTGDASKGIEQYLAGLDGGKLNSTVLKAGHHGSDTSTSEAFVSLVTPEYAVISAGKGNRYGHPHEEVLGTLRQASTTILGTYDSGTITFFTDGTKLWQK